MKVYKIYMKSEKSLVKWDNPPNVSWFMDFDGKTSFSKNWIPPHFSKCSLSSRYKLGDIIYSNPPIISKRVVDALKPLLKNQAEYLPIELDDGEYYILNCMNPIDALDETLCIKELAYEDADFYFYSRYNFIPEKVKGNCIFYLCNVRGITKFVTDEFKELIETNGFTDFDFRLIWDEDIDYAAIDEDLRQFKNAESYFPIVRWIENAGKRPYYEMLHFMKKKFKYKINTGLPQIKQISKDADAYLKTGIIPEGFKDLDDYSGHLAVCYMDAFHFFSNFHLKEVGDENGVRDAIVADNEYYVFFVFEHMKNILEGKNPSGNDLLQLLETIPNMKHGEKKYMPIY